jgi:serine/threonine protein kinase
MSHLDDKPNHQKPDPSGLKSDNKPDTMPEVEGETLSSAPSSARKFPMIGDYRIIREIGSGGMGVVYEAEQQHPKRLVALKVIQGARLLDEENVKLFEREAQALARLKHPGIAAIYESEERRRGSTSSPWSWSVVRRLNPI